MNRKYQQWLSAFLKVFATLFLGFLAGCDFQTEPEQSEKTSVEPKCDADNGGLRLPPDFCALVVANNLGFPRHLDVSEEGHLYVTLRNRTLKLGGLLALQDNNGDGKMDDIHKVNQYPGMGIKIDGDYLYYAADDTVYRYTLSPDDFRPYSMPEILITGFPLQTNHSGKPFVIVDDEIMINIGAKTNACQIEDRVPGDMGIDPCPELAHHAGIWTFNRDKNGQLFQRDGKQFASGIRNAYALDWHPVDETLYVVQHGRDQLHELWPDIYTAVQDQQMPAEEMLAVTENQTYAWPYCYYDDSKARYVMAPEYLGDGEDIGRCQQFSPPVLAFPAHYGPNDMAIYQHDAFPPAYHNGIFVAFHGASHEKNAEGERYAYQVVFVPYEALHGKGDWQVFADGFAGVPGEENTLEPEYRPTGLTIGPDGSLYVVDSVQGKIWRILYKP